MQHSMHSDNAHSYGDRLIVDSIRDDHVTFIVLLHWAVSDDTPSISPTIGAERDESATTLSLLDSATTR